MTKIEKDYYNRSDVERSCLEEDTWCNKCDQADLGLIEPHEYEEYGRVFIEGKCRKCGEHVVSEIIDEKALE